MKLIYRQHAVRRMFERSISTAEVDAALASGRVIEDYPSDTPYPSRLWLGFAGNRPLHVVYADNPGENGRIIISVYEPNPALWLADLATRKTP